MTGAPAQPPPGSPQPGPSQPDPTEPGPTQPDPTQPDPTPPDPTQVDPPRPGPPSRLPRPAITVPLRRFLATEVGSGVLLVAATVVALLWANSPFGDSYQRLWATRPASESAPPTSRWTCSTGSTTA